MNIVKYIDQYNIDYVYFNEPIKNIILNNSKFIKITYSSPLFSLNGIYVSFHLDYTSIEKYYNKLKIYFDWYKYEELINKLTNIEESLLKKYVIKGKTPQYKMSYQINQGYIKVFSDEKNNMHEKNNVNENNTFLLKICGIWESNYEYGITYKFLHV
jgi:hypothetical protein